MGRLKNIYKRVENTSNINSLSPTQQDILYLLTEEFKTPQEVAKIRNTTDKAVYKVIGKLKKLGFIKAVEKHSYLRGGQYSVKTISSDKQYRYHAQKFRIEILQKTDHFINFLKKGDKDILDNNTIMLYDDYIVIYSNKDFWGNTVDECVRLSFDYWGRFITLLENHYKIILRKGIKLFLYSFGGEIAKVGDPLARLVNIQQKHLQVRDSKGTLRLIIDKSFKFNELETISKDHHIEDMEKIEKLYKDYLENPNILLPKELQNKFEFLVELVGNMAIIQNNTQKQLQEVITILKEK